MASTASVVHDPQRHLTINFAVTHNAAFPTTMWYGAILGLRGAHEASRVYLAAWRCNGVAARGARAAAGDAGGRICQPPVARWFRAHRGGLSKGSQRSRLRR